MSNRSPNSSLRLPRSQFGRSVPFRLQLLFATKPSPGHIQAAIEKGSLRKLEIGTGTKTGTNEESTEGKTAQVIDFMVRLKGESSNFLFEILEEWNQILPGTSLEPSLNI